MNLKNKPPIFVPAEYRAEIEKLSKAALMDLAWDFAAGEAGSTAEEAEATIMNHLRRRAEVVMVHRRQA